MGHNKFQILEIFDHSKCRNNNNQSNRSTKTNQPKSKSTMRLKSLTLTRCLSRKAAQPTRQKLDNKSDTFAPIFTLCLLPPSPSPPGLFTQRFEHKLYLFCTFFAHFYTK